MRPGLLTVGEAARVLKMSSGGVRWLVDTGRLKAVRTGGGLRLLRAGDVARFARERRGQANRRRADLGVQVPG